MRAVLAAALTLALAPLTACTVYFGDDDGDDDVCAYGDDDGAEADPIAPIRLVDPYSLTCTDFGGWGGGGGCGPCGACDPPPEAPLPTWGFCDSQCTALGEGECLATEGCRATYDYACYTGDGPCTAEVPYTGCYQVDQSGALEGDCLDLADAWQCSTRDDCVALHDFSTGGSEFVQCRVEGAACEYIGVEEECLARPDCAPRYEGTDCTCDPSGNCTCETWTFADCITGRNPGDPTPPPPGM
jgi:hypothetical protein